MLGADTDGRDVSENISNQSPLESRCLVEFVLCLFQFFIKRDKCSSVYFVIFC